MTGSLLAILGLSLFTLGYKIYSKYLAKEIYSIEDEVKTPSKEFEDGNDYVPTKKHILFGHHFTSIAGLAPILGPCIAICWGWLPALIWIVLGTVFIGAVHDFGSLVISIKEKGRSIADISGTVINSRVRIMFLIFVIILSWLVLAVFTNGISNLFTKPGGPQSVIPINIEIILALIMGHYIYKKKINPLIPSIIILIILYLSIFVGLKYPISLSNNFWIYFLFLYSAIASLLPVWRLLQPRDFINSHQLILALFIILISIFISNPEVSINAIQSHDDNPPLFPFLFITIACGAISGFHGLVSSGTTSKQIENLKDSRLIGYGAALGEGTLALLTTIAAVCGIALYANIQPHEHDLSHFAAAKAISFETFPNSVAALIHHCLIDIFNIKSNSMHLFNGLKTFVIIIMISFAATTLDSATRICRFMFKELGNSLNINFLKNKFIGTFFAVIPAMMLIIIPIGDKTLSSFLWPLFGASNQMLAALTLMIISFYFWNKKKKIAIIIVPMFFISIICISSFIVNFSRYDSAILLIFNGILLCLVIWLLIEGLIHFIKNKK